MVHVTNLLTLSVWINFLNIKFFWYIGLMETHFCFCLNLNWINDQFFKEKNFFTIWCTSKIIHRFVRFGFRYNNKERWRKKREEKKKRKFVSFFSWKSNNWWQFFFLLFVLLRISVWKKSHKHTFLHWVMEHAKSNTSSFVMFTFKNLTNKKMKFHLIRKIFRLHICYFVFSHTNRVTKLLVLLRYTHIRFVQTKKIVLT